jgi:hypothetical protein
MTGSISLFVAAILRRTVPNLDIDGLPIVEYEELDECLEKIIHVSAKSTA